MSQSVPNEPHLRPASAPELVRPLEDPAWFPRRLGFAHDAAVFTRTTREELSAQPFLVDECWDRSQADSAALPLQAVRQAPKPERAPGFIWHTGFCCSTLIAACLDWPGLSVSLKEPVALVDLAKARSAGDLRADGVLTQGLVRLLGRSFDPGGLTLVKPATSANGLIDAVSTSCGPMLFLHVSLRRFLLAVAKGGEDRRFFVRSLLSDRAMAHGAVFSLHEVTVVTDMQAAAVVWRLQMREFRAVAARLGPERTMLLDAEDFLRDPPGVLSRLDGFFQIGLGPERIAGIVDGPKMRQHAKAPHLRFDADHESRALAGAERSLGVDLQGLEAWSARVLGDRHPAA